MACLRLTYTTAESTLKLVHSKTGVTSKSCAERACSSYVYGFQGQLKDNEVNGSGNSLAFKYRIHDPRLGRFLSLDPLANRFAWNSPYAFAENKVIQFIELEGAEIFLSKAQRVDYGGGFGHDPVKVFSYNAAVSVYNEFVDLFNYAGELDKIDIQEGEMFSQKSQQKVKSDVSNAAAGIHKYVTTVTPSQFKDDVVDAASNVETYEGLAGGLVFGYLTRSTSLLSKGKKIPGNSVDVDGIDVDKSNINSVTTPLCFVAGVKVMTQEGYTNIENLVIGDTVLSFNEVAEIQELKVVERLYVNDSITTLVELSLGDRQILCTPEHPFYFEDKWIEAKSLKVGSSISVLDEAIEEVVLKDLRIINDTLVTVYNFSVEDNHNYYVSELGVLVHNNCKRRFAPTKNGAINKEIENVADGNGTPRRNPDGTQKVFGAREANRPGYGAQKRWKGAKEWEVEGPAGSHYRILERTNADGTKSYGYSEDIDYKNIYEIKPLDNTLGEGN